MATASASVPATRADLATTMSGFAALSNSARVGLMIAVAALVAVAIAAVMWARTPDYRVLFSNLSDRDGGAIVAALGSMNVQYKLAEGGGAILVPAGQVHETRLRLASQGLPRGSSVGFELLESQKFGITQFQEQVNYQRALEGELSRSIQSLAQVAQARVHLAIPKPSVFLREQQKPTASVILHLHGGKSLDRNQIAGIVHLVSSSVPELTMKNVSIVDQNGALLSSSAENNDLRLDPNQLAYVQTVEASIAKRVNEILEPIVGRQNFRAQIHADVDFTQTESTDERYKPNSNPTDTAIRSTQSSESASTGGPAGAGGVPGALTNQPPVPTQAPIAGGAQPPKPPAGQAPAGNDTVVRNPSATQRSTVTNYEVDKTIRHTRAATGQVRRLSAAVVVNWKKAEGVDKPAALDDKEIENLTALVKEAMGFREDRGDTIKVSSAPFSIDALPAADELPLWKRPEVIAMAIDAAKVGFVALLLLYIVLGVLRPTLRQLATPHVLVDKNAEAAEQAAIAEAADAEGASGTTRPALPDGATDPEAIQRALRGPDKMLNAREIAKADPKLVANVVRGWVNNKDE